MSGGQGHGNQLYPPRHALQRVKDATERLNDEPDRPREYLNAETVAKDQRGDEDPDHPAKEEKNASEDDQCGAADLENVKRIEQPGEQTEKNETEYAAKEAD